MSSASSPPAFSVAGVEVRFGEVRALDVERLEIPGGGLTLVVGPNGAGKTTLLRVMAGLLAPGAGGVAYRGAPVAYGRAGLAHRRRVTLLAQDPFLFRGDVLGNVAYGPRARGVPAREAAGRAREALEAVGCAELAGRGAAGLSGGERRRVALARALATGAETLLLDEPTSHVDEENTARIRGVVASLAARGTTLVVSTHQPEWTEGIAPRIVRLAYGRVAPPG